MEKISQTQNSDFLVGRVGRSVILLNVFLTILYFYVIAFTFQTGNRILFSFLIIGEIFHVYQALAFMYTVWQTEYSFYKDDKFMPSVDVFITVAGEPEDIVSKTVSAVLQMEYLKFKVYVLNDGYVAKKENWKNIEIMTESLGAHVITRKRGGGAKAGNINNALRNTFGEFVVIFDADHVPHKDFLKKTIPFMVDPSVAFVQSPQFYKNFSLNYITLSSWAQQELFFGPLCKGRNRMNCVTMCGTNMVIRRKALISVGGMDSSITEDFMTSVLLHQKGWTSVYVPEVLAEGLAPEDFLSYSKQQYRWARGSLDVIFRKNLFFRKGLNIKQKIQYFSSASFYLSGLVVLIDAIIPLAYLFGGEVAILTSSMKLAAVFIPYIFITIYILEKSTNFSFVFRGLAFSMSSFAIHILALFSSIFGLNTKFSITPKRRQGGNFIYLVFPHIVYVVLVVTGMYVAINRDGFSASFITNSVWALLNVSVFIPFIYAATPFAMEREKTQRIISEEYL